MVRKNYNLKLGIRIPEKIFSDTKHSEKTLSKIQWKN
jgi:hypothetical protein